MPIAAKTTRRYRGKELVLLRRVKKVYAQIVAHNAKYPLTDGSGNKVRRHLDFTTEDMAAFSNLNDAAISMLLFKWPPPV